MKFAYDIIKKPIITERSMMGTQNNKYTFEVAADAGKIEIKKAVEEIFGVKVQKVNTIKHLINYLCVSSDRNPLKSIGEIIIIESESNWDSFYNKRR